MFKPAENCSLSLLILFSMDALHIEHCANALIWNNNDPIKMMNIYFVFLNILLIIRSDHQIYYYTGYGYI